MAWLTYPGARRINRAIGPLTRPEARPLKPSHSPSGLEAEVSTEPSGLRKPRTAEAIRPAGPHHVSRREELAVRAPIEGAAAFTCPEAVSYP